MGAVAITEQAIINESHDRGLVVPDRKVRPGTDNLNADAEEDEGAAGAYVAHPKKGLHTDIGAIDLNSLYPNTIRALNMGPETIVGQIRLDLTTEYIAKKRDQGQSFAAAWEGLFGTLEYTAVIQQDPAQMLTVDWETGTSSQMSAAELHHAIWACNQPWILTANGTILTSEREGIVPGLLRRWYTERQELQKKKKEATTKEDQAFWDKRQLVKKINLNSLYGAILNPYCRFNDKRIGQSTTLSGRVIAKHMNAHVNQCVTGEYDHTGQAIIYVDTDSVAGDSVIHTSLGKKTIEELFLNGSKFWKEGNKEYSANSNIEVAVYGQSTTGPVKLDSYNYVYRHKTSKRRFRLTDNLGNQVVVTEDHSVIILENEKLIEKKPMDVKKGDKILTIKLRKILLSGSRKN